VNAALNLQRQQTRTRVVDDDDAWLASPSPDDDPEMVALKRSCGAAFRQAFGEAIAELPPRSRLLLRQHLLDGLSHEQLGALHDVHPVTAFRWLREARVEIVASTRRRLGATLRLRPAEVDSLLRLLESQLDASVSRLLTALG
jgi:RNA polymerase sigma-70 factor (ECF subfamily)